MRPSFQNALAFALLLLTLVFLPAQAAAAERNIVTSQDLDYFGFDLKTQSDSNFRAAGIMSLGAVKPLEPRFPTMSPSGLSRGPRAARDLSIPPWVLGSSPRTTPLGNAA